MELLCLVSGSGNLDLTGSSRDDGVCCSLQIVVRDKGMHTVSTVVVKIKRVVAAAEMSMRALCSHKWHLQALICESRVSCSKIRSICHRV